MRDRNDRLNQLMIKSPCPASWDEMTGHGPTRHCAQCDKAVHDLALLSPREIGRLIESQRGSLCARITRGANGRIVTLPPPQVSSFEASRRASPLAAALVAGLLGVPGGAAPTPPTQQTVASDADSNAEPRARLVKEPAGVSLFGRLTDSEGGPLPGATILARNTLDAGLRSATTDADGRFVFVGLTSGVYEVEGQLEGFDIESRWDLLLNAGEHREVTLGASAEMNTMGGAMFVEAAPLREVFHASELVIIATAGESVAFEPNGESEELRTELFVTSVLKGEAPQEVLTVERYGPRDPDLDEMPPGSTVLAFLNPAEEGIWQSADWHFGLRVLPADTLAAYEERLAKLGRIEHGTESYPAELLAWLVATTEDPLTREGAVHELDAALNRLDSLANQRGSSTEHAAEDLRGVLAGFLYEGGSLEKEPTQQMLAAPLIEEHRGRLVRALESTRGITPSDLELYSAVHRWQPARAVAWLVQQLRRNPPSDLMVARQAIEVFAEELPDGDFAELTEEMYLADEEGELEYAVDRFRQALGWQ